jgi:hypothetical protein
VANSRGPDHQYPPPDCDRCHEKSMAPGKP